MNIIHCKKNNDRMVVDLSFIYSRINTFENITQCVVYVNVHSYEHTSNVYLELVNDFESFRIASAVSSHCFEIGILYDIVVGRKSIVRLVS